MSGFDHPSALNDIGPIAVSPLKHLSEVDLRKISIFHPLLKMGSEFKLPLPLRRPFHAVSSWTPKDLSLPWMVQPVSFYADTIGRTRMTCQQCIQCQCQT
jgi:hypothetical protein